MKSVTFITVFLIVAAATAINIRKCNETEDLFDAQGNYLKSLCVVSRGYAYSTSKRVCKEAGMKLFVINNQTTQDALAQSTFKRFASRDYVRLWINGRSDWFIEDTNEHLFDGVNWLIYDRSIQCLSIVRHKMQDDMKISGYGCTGKACPYCEYIKTETEN